MNVGSGNRQREAASTAGSTFEGDETRVWCSESQVSGKVERIEIKDALALVSQNPVFYVR